MGKNIIHSIYQEYCDSMEEGRETRLAGEEMEKGIRGLCDEETAKKIGNIVLDYKTVSDAERFAEGFRCGVRLLIECMAGGTPVPENCGELLQ